MALPAIQIDPRLEERLKEEASRRGLPISELIDDALRTFLATSAKGAPPGAGAFSSGLGDTAERAEQVLRETGFGRD